MDDIEDRHWSQSWPQGDIDNSVRDETIMNWPRDPPAKDPPIRYHDK